MSRRYRILAAAVLAACLIPLASAQAAERDREGVRVVARQPIGISEGLAGAARAAQRWLAHLWAFDSQPEGGLPPLADGTRDISQEGVGLDPHGRPWP